MTRPAWRRATALLALGLGAIACDGRDAARRDGPPPRQAIVILLDAARADRFSGYGYARATTPRLDELGRHGLVFTRCFAHATQTRASLSNLFYSRYLAVPLIPENPRIPLVSPDDLFRTFDPEAISLPRAMAAAGIATAGVSAHSWIRADSDLAAEFDEFHDLSATLRFPPYQHYPSAEQVVDWLIDWLDDHRGRDFFLYVHLMDTHFPHVRGADARTFFDGEPDTPALFDEMGRPRDTSAALRGRDRAHLDALYDGSLRFADRQVGRLLDHLAGAGRLDEMVVVVTADHGEELLEQPERFGHGGPWRDVLGGCRSSCTRRAACPRRGSTRWWSTSTSHRRSSDCWASRRRPASGSTASTSRRWRGARSLAGARSSCPRASEATAGRRAFRARRPWRPARRRSSCTISCPTRWRRATSRTPIPTSRRR